MKPVFDDTEFTIIKDRESFSTENYWFNLRVKKDPRTNEEYADVLIGRKGELDKFGRNLHMHCGLNLDGSTRFIEDRGKIVDIERQVDSKLKGRISKEKIQVSENVPKARLTFKVIADFPTKTVDVRVTEANVQES